MRKIQKRNYLYLVLIIITTVLATLYVSHMYKQSKRVETDFYKYSSVITFKEFDTYIVEYPDSIIYVYDKYNSSYKDFESKLREKVETHFLTNNFVYIDKRGINNKIIKEFKDNFGMNLNYDNKPLIIYVEDGKVVDIIEVNNTTNVNDLKLEVYE